MEFFPAIVGTLYLVLGSIVVSLPLGVFSAIYLTEYASPRHPALRAIRTAIHRLAGVPSVVFGLFGLAVFVKIFGFGVSCPFWFSHSGYHVPSCGHNLS